MNLQVQTQAGVMASVTDALAPAWVWTCRFIAVPPYEPAATPARSIGGSAVGKRTTIRRRVPDGEGHGGQRGRGETGCQREAMLETRRGAADPPLLSGASSHTDHERPSAPAIGQ